MVPLSVLADPARRAALSTMLLFGAVVVGYVYFTSLYNQGVLHFSPLEAGLAIGLSALATSAAAQTSAHDGSLVTDYKAAFLVPIGISVVAILIVAVQMRIRAAAKGTA
jgi:hypothetical protein